MSLIESDVMVEPINDSKKRKSSSDKQSLPEGSTLNLLDSLKKIRLLTKIILNTPELDEEKIAHFKAEIAAGRYEILSENIAQKMLAEAES